jgi:ELWxxDGT repeat protein
MPSIYFSRVNDSLGFELWVTDGTPEGTRLVKNINPTDSSSPGLLTSVNGKLFFLANDGAHGTELWRSDGTETGTVMVADSVPGTASPDARLLTAAGNTLFYIADDGTHGDELWASDGTAAGTGMVKDINPSGNSFAAGDLNDIANVNGTLFVDANDGTHGEALWKSNGTAAGTVLVKDVDTLEAFTPFQGSLFFSASDSTHDAQLWKSGGTPGTTFAVQDGGSGTKAFGPTDLTDVNGTLFFAALNGFASHIALWKSDGTAQGTEIVKDFGFIGFNSVGSLINVNGTLFFFADDRIDANNPNHGNELWKSDGTAGGTVLVKDINPTGNSGGSFENMVAVGGLLYFTANDGTHGVELWKSDGTANGTVMVKDISTSGSSNPYNLVNVGGTLFFGANDSGNGLWKSDGTEAGTIKVADGLISSSSVHSKVFVVADDALVGGPGNDTLTGTSGPDLIEGFGGADTIYGLGGDDILYGNSRADDGKLLAATDDAMSGDVIYGGDGNDMIRGNQGTDHLYGEAGVDTIFGGRQSDFVYGGDGDDFLYGDGSDDNLESGDDLLDGGTGQDTMTGGPGNDRFVFAPGYGADTITDFTTGAGTPDKIVLSPFAGLHSLSDVLAVTSQQGADAVINFGNGDTLTLLGAQKANLSADDFVLEFFGQPAVKLAAFNPANGWTSDDQFPRALADVNGDGSADIVGFGNGGVYVSLANGDGSFAGQAIKLAAFNPANGWTSDNAFHRELADVNGDHLADIIGFGNAGVLVSLATGGGNFAAPEVKLSAFNPANGWSSDDAFHRELADVNGDGLADIIGFGNPGVLVSLATGGGNFAAPEVKLAAFNPANGWTSNDQFPRELADVNGDGMADIVGFGNGGVYVALATGGGNFAPFNIELAAFHPANGWNSNNQFPRELADVNGDGMADIVGFGNGGVYVAVATGGGHFASPIIDIAAFNPANGWSSDDAFPRGLADVNHDGSADIVGFGNPGVLVALAHDFLLS